jgi:adenylosuccinate lyase
VAHHALAALTLVTRVLRDLRVHDDAMARAAHEARDQICTEALMLALGRHIGKQRAYAVVYALSQRAQDDGSPLWASVCASPEVTEHLNQQDLDALFDPGRQLGEAGVLVDGVLAALDQWMTKRNGWHAGA